MEVTAFFGVVDRVDFVPHYVRYYASIGASRFVAVVHRGTDNPMWSKLLEFSGLPIVMVWGGDVRILDGPADNAAINAARKAYDGWHIVADLDEFHYFGGLTIQQVVEQCEKIGAQGVGLKFADRLGTHVFNAAGEAVGYATPNLPERTMELDDLFPFKSNLTEFIGGNHHKVGLVRCDIPTGSGHHSASCPLLSCAYETHHFKWTAGIHTRLQRRRAFLYGAEFPWAYESDNALAMVSPDHIRSAYDRTKFLLPPHRAAQKVEFCVVQSERTFKDTNEIVHPDNSAGRNAVPADAAKYLQQVAL